MALLPARHRTPTQLARFNMSATGALRDLARHKAWEPSIDDCRWIAERQVEQLRRHGVLQFILGVARAHGVGATTVAAGTEKLLPIWAAWPAREA